jgi:type IV secretory pathway protease TraF
MNHAARKLAQRQHRMSIIAQIVLAVLLLATVALLAAGIWQAATHIPVGWWLPIEQRPFGGLL